jgi:hypothetical protein
VACGLCLWARSSAAIASENGGFSNFPAGAQTVASAFLPPPGATEFYAYLLYYSANSFRDGAGRPISPGLKVDVFAQAPRVVHTWNLSLGGVNISSGLVAESDYIKAKTGTQRDEDVGMYLYGIEPFDLTASYGNWHFLSGTHFYIPGAAYNRNALANATSHYAALAQQFDVTWLPTPRIDISINPDLEFNMRNKATGYLSGDQFGFTWGASYRPFASDLRWQFGLNGFYAYQFTDDRIHGEAVAGGGSRLRKNAIGPQGIFWFSPAAALIVKEQHEMGVINGPKGDLYWVEFAFPL